MKEYEKYFTDTIITGPFFRTACFSCLKKFLNMDENAYLIYSSPGRVSVGRLCNVCKIQYKYFPEPLSEKDIYIIKKNNSYLHLKANVSIFMRDYNGTLEDLERMYNEIIIKDIIE
jgi:hypothetical protein